MRFYPLNTDLTQPALRDLDLGFLIEPILRCKQGRAPDILDLYEVSVDEDGVKCPRDQAKEEESTTSDGADPDAPQLPRSKWGVTVAPPEEARSVLHV